MKNWKFGGTLLDDFGVVTLLDDVLGTPERRGENIVIPFRQGRVHTRKYYDQRTILLGVLITGTTITDVEDNFRQLKTLCANSNQQALYVETNDGTPLTAQAEVNGSIQPSISGPVAVKTTIPFTLADPFWYEEDAVVENVNINAGTVNPTINNTGSVETDKIDIVLTGPLSNTVILNGANNVSLTYGTAISSGHTVTISRDATSGQFTAVHSVSGNVIGNVTHSGSPSLMVFEPGDNDLTITDGVGTTGTVEFTFTPRHV